MQLQRTPHSSLQSNQNRVAVVIVTHHRDTEEGHEHWYHADVEPPVVRHLRTRQAVNSTQVRVILDRKCNSRGKIISIIIVYKRSFFIAYEFVQVKLFR